MRQAVIVSGLPRGKITDYGDLIKEVRWLVKGQRLRVVVHVGAPARLTDADRVARPGTRRTTPERITRMTDVRADKKVSLSTGQWYDEADNEVPTPDGISVGWSIDEAGAAFFNLTDNGDGSAVLAATGVLGGAIVHLQARAPGVDVQGDELYVAVPGNAQRVAIVTGPEEEVTPD